MEDDATAPLVGWSAVLYPRFHVADAFLPLQDGGVQPMDPSLVVHQPSDSVAEGFDLVEFLLQLHEAEGKLAEVVRLESLTIFRHDGLQLDGSLKELPLEVQRFLEYLEHLNDFESQRSRGFFESKRLD